MRKAVYRLVVEHFRAWGIDYVFGIPGKSISPLMIELESQEITYVLGRHETGCGYEAGGYSLATKKLSVVIGTSGPGGTNLLTAAAQAKEFGVPVLFITGHPSAQETGRALSQESSQFGTDLTKMFEPVTLFSAFVQRGDMLHLYLQHAVEKACMGERGPVHLCVPFDVLMEEIEPFFVPLPPQVPQTVSPNLAQIIAMMDEAKSPVLFLGKGALVSDVCEEIRTIAEHWNIPIVTAPGGKGAIPTHHPLMLGGFGLGGCDKASQYLKSGIDLMIVIGSKLCDMSLSGFTSDMYPEQVLHFDYEATFVGKSIPVPTVPVLGDVKFNLQRVVELSGASRTIYDIPQPSRSPAQTESNEGFMLAGAAFQALRSALPHNAILFGDAGSHSFYAVQHFDIYEAGTFYLDEVFISMGAAIGYSIGAKLALPDVPVVCVTGDGCMMMHGTEISTAVNASVPVIFVVLNNGRLDMVDKGMSYNTGVSVGAVYDNPIDIAMFARSMGATAFRCRNEQDIMDATLVALGNHGPTVIEIMVDPLEIPPILTRLLTLDDK